MPHNWAGELYPDADSQTEAVATIARDIDELEFDPDVNGLARDGDGRSGAYLADLGDVSEAATDKPVKGAALELRTARREASDLRDGETLKLSHDPGTDLTKIEDVRGIEDPIGYIAKRVYEDPDDDDISDVKGYLGVDSGGKDVEFDGLRVSSDGDSDIIYFEAKNRKDLDKDDIQPQASKYLATRLIQGDTDLKDSKMVVVTRTESEAKDLNDAFSDEAWFTAKTIDDV